MLVVKLLFHILWHGEEAHRNVLIQSAFPFYLWIHTWALSLRSLLFVVMKKEGVMGVLIFQEKGWYLEGVCPDSCMGKA